MIGWLRRFLEGFTVPLSDQLSLHPAEGRMRPVQIRAYSPDDFLACRELYVLNESGRFPSGVLPEFEAALQSGRTLFLVAEKDGEICGCGGVAIRTAMQLRVVLCFGLIHPKHQHQGLGTTLLLARLAILPTDNWIVQMSPVPASRGFYERFNFRELGRAQLPNGEEVSVHYVRISPDAHRHCGKLLADAGVTLAKALDDAILPVTP